MDRGGASVLGRQEVEESGEPEVETLRKCREWTEDRGKHHQWSLVKTVRTRMVDVDKQMD